MAAVGDMLKVNGTVLCGTRVNGQRQLRAIRRHTIDVIVIKACINMFRLNS